MNAKQQRFADEYLIDLNATQAAIRAGYSKKTAAQIGERLLRNVDIADYVADRRQKVSAKLEITHEWIVENLRDVAMRCMQVEPVLDRKGQPVLVENRNGEFVPAYIFQAAGANRALELLGKHVGMFDEKMKITSTVTSHLAEEDRALLTHFMQTKGKEILDASSPRTIEH